MNDEEDYVGETGPAAFWGGLIVLALLCGCNKMPQKIAAQDKTPTCQVQQTANLIAAHTR